MKVYQPGEEIPPNEPFAFITAKGGHYLVKRNAVFEACVLVEDMPDLPEQKETFTFKAPKIPLQLYCTVLAFMAAVYRKYKSEALVLLTFDDGKWGLHVPKQKVSATGIDYRNDDHIRAVGSIHSHPGMTHRPSGTDEHDELDFDGIHIVTAAFEPIPSLITCMGVANGRRFEFRPWQIIEGLARVKSDFPADWLARVEGEVDWREVNFQESKLANARHNAEHKARRERETREDNTDELNELLEEHAALLCELEKIQTREDEVMRGNPNGEDEEELDSERETVEDRILEIINRAAEIRRSQEQDETIRISNAIRENLKIQKEEREAQAADIDTPPADLESPSSDYDDRYDYDYVQGSTAGKEMF